MDGDSDGIAGRRGGETMTAIYLCARYGRRAEMAQIAARLRTLGYTITSRWHDDPQETLDKVILQDVYEMTARNIADECLDDILKATHLLSFSEPPGITSTRGGRHFEAGAAYLAGK